MKEKTIVAISTPIGTGAVSIIRNAGLLSLSVCQKMFKSNALDYKNIKPRFLYLGNIELDEINEECLMAYFKAPNSYTGEDLIEFQCHGGNYLAEKIYNACVQNGATVAQCGEFTKRAFMNGKVSLDKAEGIIDIINAESDSELKAGYQLLGGKLLKEIRQMQNQLKDSLAQIEVTIDYPEHDDETATFDSFKKVILEIEKRIKQLIKNSENAKYIKSGINVAIIGKPNVGKSSILNALVGEDRAIVTSIAGTTRDTLKETITYKGFKINFIDTAGLRDSSNEVEILGIEKAKKEMEKADIILFVLDFSEEITEDEKKYIKYLKNKNCIIILNKIDKKQQILINFDDFLKISAKENLNIEKIKEKIIEKVIQNKIDFSGLVITNARHIEALKNSVSIINKIKSEIKTQTADIVDMEVKKLWNELGKITGETENENIIDAIFAKFCLGK